MINQTTGLKYRYIIITNGATSAINCCLRHFRGKFDHVCMRKYGYPYYPDMIKKAGYAKIERGSKEDGDPLLRKINLIDSPSNPEGLQTSVGGDRNTIWDAVYHSKIYNASPNIIPPHRLMVGSYSKLLGVTGARVGFIATNNKADYEALSHESLIENATISVLSQQFILNILRNLHLDKFFQEGKKSLDNNREIFHQIRNIFDNQPVQQKGMFYCVNVDKKALQILNKCGIKYVSFEDDLIRLSLGQTNKLTQTAIGTILKEDKI
jgi:aspartate/methionine/tyrosine aminotransferase